MSDNSTLHGGGRERLPRAGVLARRAVLVVVSHESFGTAMLLDRPQMVLGRSEECDVIVADSRVSRRHCLFSVDQAGDFYVEDLGSKNSTFVNRERIRQKTQLYYGDRVVAGDTIMRFFLEEDLER